MVHVRSIVVPESKALSLESSDWPWDIIHRDGTVADALPDFPPAAVDCLLVWLATETGPLPPLLFRLDLPGARLISAMRRHTAKVFAQQLKSTEPITAREICAAFGEEFDGGLEWIDYFARQWTHLENEDDAILIVADD